MQTIIFIRNTTVVAFNISLNQTVDSSEFAKLLLTIPAQLQFVLVCNNIVRCTLLLFLCLYTRMVINCEIVCHFFLSYYFDFGFLELLSFHLLNVHVFQTYGLVIL